MAEQKNNMTDRQLAEELQKGKRGGLGGRLLELSRIHISEPTRP